MGPVGFFRGLLRSFKQGYREARSAGGDDADERTWDGVTLVEVGTPDRELVDRLASRLRALLRTAVDVHPRSVTLQAHDRDTDDGPQWDAELLGEALDELAAGPRCVLGVTDVDLFARDLNFVFGFGRDGIGLFSYERFLDGAAAEAPRLDDRVTKQALSSIGGALGVGRCDDETCVRAFPNSLAEHDRKQLRLCSSCREDFERALGHPVEL